MVLTLFVALFSWKRQLLLKTGTKEGLWEAIKITQKNRWAARPRETFGRERRGTFQAQGQEVFKGPEPVQVTLQREVSLLSKVRLQQVSILMTKKNANWLELLAVASGWPESFIKLWEEKRAKKYRNACICFMSLMLLSDGITAEVGTSGDQDHAAETRRRRPGLARVQGPNIVTIAEVAVRAGGLSWNRAVSYANEVLLNFCLRFYMSLTL